MDFDKAATDLLTTPGPVKALKAMLKSFELRNVDLTKHPAAPKLLLAIVRIPFGGRCARLAVARATVGAGLLPLLLHVHVLYELAAVPPCGL